ncbi:MAG: putative signal peptide protein, partial [Bacteroidota bacterium]
MRLIFSIFLMLLGSGIYAQVMINSTEYQHLKETNSLAGVQLFQDTTIYNTESFVISPTYNTKSNGCECYVEPDASYSLALAPNDDGSSDTIQLPFSVCLYGQTFNQIFINNNGNVTFNSAMGTFSATAFPSNGDAIIAPFWGDVDTRNGLGQVLYKITPSAVYVNWVDVGYYSMHGDLRNTFQLVLTDGADPAIEGGNVAFCYKDMAWTTG